jgi:hypothetical protein
MSMFGVTGIDYERQWEPDARYGRRAAKSLNITKHQALSINRPENQAGQSAGSTV